MCWVWMTCLLREFRNWSRVHILFRDSALKSFDVDENVSVFETTIRFLGGLLSAHMLLVDNVTIVSEYNARHPSKRFGFVTILCVAFTYDRHLLDLAIDLGNRLLPAFQPNGLAYGSVNLRRGVLSTVRVVLPQSLLGNTHLQSCRHRIFSFGVCRTLRTHR